MRNVAEQVLAIASHAAGSVGQSKLRAREMVDTQQEELRVKFSEDCTADEARRGQTETRLTTLGSSIEGRQKR